MKRILVSLLLVLTLVTSSFCAVSAEGLSSDWLKDQFTRENNAVCFNVNLEAKSGSGEWGKQITSYANAPIDVRASVDMTDITNKLVTAKTLAPDVYESEFKLKKVEGSFELRVNLGEKFVAPETFAPATVTFIKDGTPEVVAEENNLFKLSSRVVENSVVSVILTLKEGNTIETFLAECPDTIMIEQKGVKYTSRTAILTAEVANPYTAIRNIEDNEIFAEVRFTEPPSIVNEVKITEYTGPGGGAGGGGDGGAAVTNPKYTLVLDANGGSAFEAESYKKGQVVSLEDKIPVKEGYIFDGWYADAALTEEITSVTIAEDTFVYAKWVKERHPVPETLNGVDHFAYVIGYPDGTVRPNDNITRAEVTTIFFRLLKDEVRNANLTAENTFDDVNDDDWHNVAISTMAKLGIINGRFENAFVPDANITRAEFTAICARFDDTEIEYEGTLNDIEGHWAEEYIKRASAYGWIEGYSDNTFRPDQFITRAEAMTLINRVLNRIPRDKADLLDDMTKWSDNSNENEWYYVAVQEATNSHEFERKNNAYEAWTKLTENKDWAKLEATEAVVEETEATEETEEVVEETETVEE